MTILAFAGPSLLPEDRGRFAGVEWRPPAEAGDLLRLAAEPPDTICLIDGYFDHRPAVRHKEILLLLSEGVRILGASSIGALRAAEMSAFGMVGVGAIYRAYARGGLTGDDEVALVHGPAKWGWRPLSVPLVDVRATLCRALREKVLTIADARALLRAAAATHYTERSWEGLIGPAPLAAATLGRLTTWLDRGQVAQKRIDALACLASAAAGITAAQPRPRMVKTAFVDALARECGVTLDAPLPAPGRAAARSSPSARHSGTDNGIAPIAGADRRRAARPRTSAPPSNHANCARVRQGREPPAPPPPAGRKAQP